MKTFFNNNRNSFFVQFVLIAFLISLYLYSDPEYVSSVTIEPLIVKETIISKNGAKLAALYTPSYSKQLYLQELANKDSRLEIYKEFLSKNEITCKNSPKIQFHEKNDKSFPISGHFTKITVKSNCIDFVQNFVTYLSNVVHKRVVTKIQNMENQYLENERQELLLHNNYDMLDLEAFFANRKEILQKLIPLLKKQDNESSFNELNLVELNKYETFSGKFNNDADSVKINITIPLSRSAAQAELDFLSSITDLNLTSVGFVNRTAAIERYKIKHDFSNSKLIKISDAEQEKISNMNFYIVVFLIFLILSIGFIFILLNQYKYYLIESQQA